MTFSNVVSKSFASNLTTGTTVTFSPGVNIVAGSTIVVAWAAPFSAIDASSVVDNSVQAGVANVYTRRAVRTSGATLKGGTAYCAKTTRLILAANTITITLNASTNLRSGVMQAWLGGNGNPVLGANTGGVDNDSTSPVASPSFTPNHVNALVVAAQFYWNNTSATAPGISAANPSAIVTVHSAGTASATDTTLCSSPNIGSVSPFIPTISYSIMTNGCTDVINFTDVGGTVFPKSLTGAANFTGSPTRPKVVMQRKPPVALISFSGARGATPTARLISSVLRPVGALASPSTRFRALTGSVLAPTGTVTTATAYLRTLAAAVFAPTGAQTRVKAVSKAISGALSFVGAQTHIAAKVNTASFTPTGALSKLQTLGRTLTGALSFTTSINRLTSHKLSAAIETFAGMVAASQRPPFTGTFRPTGATTHGVQQRTLFAALNFSGRDPIKATTRLLVSSLIASGVMHTQYLPPVGPTPPGGGGYGALMSDAHFQRYKVAAAWRGVKRVKA